MARGYVVVLLAIPNTSPQYIGRYCLSCRSADSHFECCKIKFVWFRFLLRNGGLIYGTYRIFQLQLSCTESCRLAKVYRDLNS